MSDICFFYFCGDFQSKLQLLFSLATCITVVVKTRVYYILLVNLFQEINNNTEKNTALGFTLQKMAHNSFSALSSGNNLFLSESHSKGQSFFGVRLKGQAESVLLPKSDYLVSLLLPGSCPHTVSEE